MARFFKKRSQNKGQAPGSLIFIGQNRVDHPTIELISYNKEQLNEAQTLGVEEVPVDQPGYNQWYNITGLDDVDFMSQIKLKHAIHPLFMEDIMNTGQRAKFEEIDDVIFISLKMLQFDAKNMRVNAEQVSMLYVESLLLSFQEGPGDTFNPVRDRLKNPKSNLRNLGVSYLAYALLDTIVDNYIYLIESLGEEIDNLELEVIDNPQEDTLQKINNYKRELHYVQKVIKPVRELMLFMNKSPNQLVSNDKILPYLKDLNDLVVHAVESVETYRVVLTDYIQLYHSSMSTRMNDIMRVLTIFSAIFIPLSFFAGVYGTNFEYLPELDFQYGYPVFWGVVIIIALSLLLFFKRKGWL